MFKLFFFFFCLRGTGFLSRLFAINVFGTTVFATWGSSSTGKPVKLSFQNGVPLKQILNSIFIVNLHKYLPKELRAESLKKKT